MAALNNSTNGEHAFRILAVSDDDGLRSSRELLLKRDGYDAESAPSNAALILARVREFDAALICQSVDPDRALILSEMLRRHNPEILIMRVAGFDLVQSYEADVEIEQGPAPLLESFRHLCKR